MASRHSIPCGGGASPEFGGPCPTAKLADQGSAAETGFFLERFESVEHDGAVRGAIGHFPHAAEERSGAADQVREVVAGVRPGLIDRAIVSAQEDTSVAGPLQNQSFVLALYGVLAQETAHAHT